MSITQNFNSGDVADLADYSENGVGWSNIRSSTQAEVTGGKVENVTGFPFYRCDYELGSDDIQTSADYTGVTGSNTIAVTARVDLSTGTGYQFSVTATAYVLGRYSGTSPTNFASTGATPPSSGTATISVVGTTITGYIDGVQVIQATDSTYSTGECGGIYVSGSATLDNFSARAVSFNSVADASPMFAPLQDDAASTAVVVYEDGSVGTAATLAGGDNTEDITTTGPGSGFAAALDLDGAADYVTLASAVALTGPIGLCGWFNRDNTSSIHVLFGEAAAGATYAGLRNNTTTTLFRANGGAVVDSTHGTTSTNWHHYLFARDASDNLVLFVDGAQADSDAESGNDFTFDVLFRNTFGNYMDGQAAGVAAFDFDPSAVADLLYAGPPLTYSSGATLSADGTFDVGTYSLPYGLSGTNSAYDDLASDANLLAWYTGDANSDGTGDVNDASGNGNDGTWSADAAYADSLVAGKAFEFSGSNYIDTGIAQNAVGTTMSFMVRLKQATGSTKALLGASSSSGNGYGLETRENIDLIYFWSDNGTTSHTVSVDVPTDEWCTIGFSTDGSTAKIYLNGVQVGADISHTTPTPSTETYILGKRTSALFPLADGDLLADAMLLDRVATDAEFLSYHEAQSRYTARLRGPDGTVVETLTATGFTTGGFSDTLYNLGGEGKYRLEVLTSNDGGSVGWEQVASYEARTYETLTTLDLNILVISNNSTAANLINFLEADGHTCTKISDTGSALDDIDGMNLVVIDRDLAAPHGTNLGWLKDADIPIISLCAYLNDALALSTAAAAAFGAYSTFTVADENPLQPGLETGDVVTHGGTFDEWPQSLISGTTLLGYNTSVSARKTIGLMRAGLTNTDTNLTPNTRLVFPSKNAVSMNPTTHLGEVMAEALRLGVYWAIDPDVFEAGPSAGGDVLAGSLVESLVGSLVGPIVN